ncbi:MAG: hypothetical protein OQK73_10585 [Gammaproteobacteria bacterium]|nr:hypothetical protein [Gammaproteobacteria bacterium]
MKSYLMLVIALGGLSACALNPYPASGDKNQITVFQPYIGEFDREKAKVIASEHCEKYGKKADLKVDEGKKVIFDCK